MKWQVSDEQRSADAAWLVSSLPFYIFPLLSDSLWLDSSPFTFIILWLLFPHLSLFILCVSFYLSAPLSISALPPSPLSLFSSPQWSVTVWSNSLVTEPLSGSCLDHKTNLKMSGRLHGSSELPFKLREFSFNIRTLLEGQLLSRLTC